MKNMPEPSNDPIAALRHLTLEQVEKRLAELEGERAALTTLRRSMVARRRAQQRQSGQSIDKTEAKR
jgi:hypothetical protein